MQGCSSERQHVHLSAMIVIHNSARVMMSAAEVTWCAGAQPHARKIDETRTRMTEEERNERNAQLQRTMALLVHASGCADPECPSTNCSKVKGLFHHAVSCPLKVAGGCQLCR